MEVLKQIILTSISLGIVIYSFIDVDKVKNIEDFFLKPKLLSLLILLVLSMASTIFFSYQDTNEKKIEIGLLLTVSQ